MKLARVSNNVLINPEYISCIEQKKIKDKLSIIVTVSGKSYILDGSLKNFLDAIDYGEEEKTEQFFAG